MSEDSRAEIEITGFAWVPGFARGHVRDLRLRWACREIGLPYRIRLISAVERPGWYYAEQPWGQVPVMKDGDLHLFESGACLIHLGDRDEKLLPASGQRRADALSWLFGALNSLEPSNFEMNRIAIFDRDEPWAEARRPSLLKQGRERFARAAEAMKGREWLAGDFSIADIVMTTVLLDAERNDFLAGLPLLADYLERATARPAFQASLAEQLATYAENAPAGRDQPS